MTPVVPTPPPTPVERRRSWLLGVFVAAVYLGSVVLANWLTTRYGFIDVGFGEAATAGTFAAGGALVVRDFVQDAIGRVGVAALIVVAAGLSWLVAAPLIAVASGVAFLISEALDMAVYTPLRTRGRFGGPWWSRAVIAGAVVGSVADSLVFLKVAGFPEAAALPGQLLGKGEVALLLIVAGLVVSREHPLLREPVYAEGA